MLDRVQSLLHVSRSRSSSDNSRGGDIETGSTLVNHESPSQADFRTNLCLTLSGCGQEDPILRRCWAWYTSYLEAQINEIWNTTLVPVIVGLDPNAFKERNKWFEQLSVVYKALDIVAKSIRDRAQVSLDDIVDVLDSQKLLVHQTPEALSPQGKNVARQLVWLLCGALTMLYDPMKECQSQELRLRQSASSLRARGRHRIRAMSSSSQRIHIAEEQLHTVLGQFGELLPKVEDACPTLGSLSVTDIHHINIDLVNFYTLKHVAKLDIEWVNTMNLHLQLDQRKRILRLYRFPAFCRLLWTEEEDSFLGQLLADHRKSQVDSEPTAHCDLDISDYLREMMLSYRLLFGIDRRARKTFKGERDGWCHDSSHSSSSSTREEYKSDPLLDLLTTSPSPSPGSAPDLASLIEMLDGEERSTLYALEDFPFLGRRLAELQRFSIIQKPNDLKSLLWVDRRDMKDVLKMWIAWSVLIIGGGTLILQALQLAFQINK